MSFFTLFFCIFQIISPMKPTFGFIKIVPTKSEKTYKNLSGNNAHDRANIKELFETLGKNSKLSILFYHKKRLEKLGAEIAHVHPWIVLDEITKTQEMRNYMKKVKTDPFKWNNIIKGFIPSILHEIQKDNFFKYIEDYAKIRKIPASFINSFIDFKNPKKTNWEKLIKALIDY